MKYALLVAFFFFGSVTQALPFDCTGLRREPMGNQQFKETKVPLIPIWTSGNAFILEASIADRVFTVSGDNSPTYLMSITLGPDYTAGVNATTVPNSQGRMQISTIEQTLVHKLECREVGR